jgi:SAM-dependent methyltransferase
MTQSSVRRVPRERWEEAQRWEQALWDRCELKDGWQRPVWRVLGPLLRRAGFGAPRDDWNRWWAAQFDDYSFLPPDLGALVELGCGPFTNARLILEGRTANRVVCSDPLVREYLQYAGTWLREAYRGGAVEIDDLPIESATLHESSFDVVVLINVLDHVRDADLCLERAAGLVADGGFFVFGQDLSDEMDIARYPTDVGHPIRLGADDVRPHLEQFHTLIDRVLPRREGRNPKAHCGTLIFAGRRLPSSQAR